MCSKQQNPVGVTSAAGVLLVITLIGLGALMPWPGVAQEHDSRTSEPHSGISLTPEEKAWLAKKPTIRIRVGFFPPFHSWEEGEGRGISIDYMRLFCKAYGLRCVFFAGIPWAEAIESIGAGKDGDLILTIKHTPEREPLIAFTRDYLRLPWVIFTRVNSPFIRGIENLEGKTISVERGFVMRDILVREYPGIRLYDVETSRDAVEALATGQVDAYIGNLTVGAYLINRWGFTNVKVASPTPFGRHDQAMGVRRDWPELVSLIDRFLAAMTPREHTKIQNKWLSVRYEYGVDWPFVWKLIGAISGTATIVIIVIVLWNRRLQREISLRKQAEAALLRAQRMEAVGQLTGGVAHHFNNLLAVMLGNTEILEGKVHENPEALESTKKLKEVIDRAASLTQRLLAFSRQQMLSPKATDVKQLFDDLEDVLRRSLGDTIILNIKAADDLWQAMVDGSQLEHALLNLATNARGAMPQGGSLTIEAVNATLDDAYASRHEEVTPGDYVEICVRDTGYGMPPEVLEKAFEPFYTTKDVGEGSGLGMSMVYGFVKQSRGHIMAHSEVGHGTTVKLYLPLSKSSAVKTEAKAETDEHSPATNRKIS